MHAAEMSNLFPEESMSCYFKKMLCQYFVVIISDKASDDDWY